jgi:hypothetical protein
MDRRLQIRYESLVRAHLRSVNALAAGPAVPADGSSAQAATQAAWRFLNNERIALPALAEPLRQAGRIATGRSSSPFVLVAHDWCKLDFKTHTSKTDVLQLTHKNDVGYDLTTSLLVDAAHGAPLAPVQMHLKTAKAVHSTAVEVPGLDDHHLEQLLPTMNEVASWGLPRRPVHIIDREADSLGHFRQWTAANHLFLVRADDRRVLEWAASEFAKTPTGQKIKINLIPMGSLEGAQAVLRSDQRIHVWSPASSLYKDVFLQDWQVQHAGNKPIAAASRVVFPAPLGPISPSHSPDATRSVSASTTRGPEP